MNEIPVINWSVIQEYYDKETGEQITKYNAQRNYTVVKTDSQKIFNNTRTRCTIKIQKTCIKHPQLKLDI